MSGGERAVFSCDAAFTSDINFNRSSALATWQFAQAPLFANTAHVAFARMLELLTPLNLMPIDIFSQIHASPNPRHYVYCV